jgi:hypothetical protein
MTIARGVVNRLQKGALATFVQVDDVLEVLVEGVVFDVAVRFP